MRFGRFLGMFGLIVGWFSGMTLLSTIVNGDVSEDGVPVSFSREVAPILLDRCIACHGEKNFKGEYQLLSYDSLMQSGESGETPIEPGDTVASYLLQLVVEEDSDLRMPKDKDPLSVNQIDILRRWIDEGAQAGHEDRQTKIYDVVPSRKHIDPPPVYRAPLPVTALAVSPDGVTVAVGGVHEITFWNLETGTLKRRVHNVAERTYDLEFSPNGKVIAAASGTPGMLGEVRFFDSTSGEMKKEMVRMNDCALGLAWDLSGKKLAVAGADRTVRLLDVESGRQLVNAQHHSDWVYEVAFSQDGKRLVSASRDATAKIIDTSSGDLLTTYAGHKKPVYDSVFLPGGEEAVSCGGDGKIHLWKTKGSGSASGMSETPKDDKTVAMMGRGTHPFHDIVVTENSIFSGSSNGTIGQFVTEARNLRQVYFGNRHPVYAVTYDEKSRRLVGGDYAGCVYVWNSQGELVSQFIAAPGYRAVR